MITENPSINTHSSIIQAMPELKGIGKPLSKTAVVCHIHYSELWPNLDRNLKFIDRNYDLFISVTPNVPGNEVRNIRANHPDAHILQFPNHGRDIFPFITLVNTRLLEQYDVVCKLHTKKSPHRKDGIEWGHHLVDNILGSKENTEKVLNRFANENQLGMMVAKGHLLKGEEWWGENWGITDFMARVIGIDLQKVSPRFAAGSIFWIRGALLKPLRRLSLSARDFVLEKNQEDGTLHHAVERLFSIIAQDQGYEIGESIVVQHNQPSEPAFMETRQEKNYPKPNLPIWRTQLPCEKDLGPQSLHIQDLESLLKEKELMIQFFLSSTSWRITAPLRSVKTNWNKISSRSSSFNFLKGKDTVKFPDTQYITPDYLDTPKELMERRFINTRPVPIVHSRQNIHRVNLVVDALLERLLFGGVATSILFAFSVANHFNWPLRIITRDDRSNTEHLGLLSDIHGLPLPDNLQVVNCQPLGRIERSIDVSELDLFISTSWWSSRAIRSMTLRTQYIYLIQEYEPIFYARGDEEILANEIFNDLNCLPVINSTSLYECFCANGYKHIKENALIFNPCFPRSLYHPCATSFLSKKTHRLMFYGRPDAPRNLYHTGLRLIDAAIQKGILNDDWEIYIVGSPHVDFTFSNGVVPVQPGKLTWLEYSSLASSTDLGICLMYAPTPSYPPYDLASSGAVVLTTRFGNKAGTEDASNIIWADPDMESLQNELKNAVSLACNLKKRKQNWEASSIQRDWQKAFCPILKKLSTYLQP